MKHRDRLLLLLLANWISYIQGSGISCTSHAECHAHLRESSECVEGFCSNPFYNGGCLNSVLPDWHKIRTCHSDDPPEAETLGYCRKSPLDYTEVRALAQDWESAITSTWVLQILLSEIVDVPVSIETSQPGLVADFYNPTSRIDYGNISVDFEELLAGSRAVDCRKLKSDDPSEYKACANIVTEVWWAEYANTGTNGIEVPPQDLGALGADHWFVPRFTAKRDPTVLSYIGLGGEENRRKLAEMFKRPTTWKQYCDEVSISNCRIDDGVASRPPQTEVEEESMFVEGNYIGHFRATEKNDCDMFPTNCTGHIVDHPCHWNSFVIQQAYHLDIALESDGPSGNGGYTYQQKVQIWRAANATRSDVIIYWWHPELRYQESLGTDMEFTKVVLTPTTQECIESRADLRKLCGDDLEAKRGDPKGSCDTSNQPLKKLFAEGWKESISNPSTPKALRSPSYDVSTNFKFSELQYGQVFQYWFERGGIDSWRSDPREATCRWVVENLDHLMSFVPDSYPRIVEEKTDNFATIATVIASVSVVTVLVTSVATYMKRHSKSIYYSQIEFHSLNLFGLFMNTLCALWLALPPTDGTCIGCAWFQNVGNSIIFFPLALKVYSIHKLSTTGKNMQRLHLRSSQFLNVAILGIVSVGLFVTFWTIYYPPKSETQYSLSNMKTTHGETVVVKSTYCGAGNDLWIYASIAWQALILYPSVLLAYVASKLSEDINDTKSMLSLLLVHSFWGMMIVFSVAFVDDSERADRMRLISLSISMDVICSVLVYNVPKLLHSGDEMETEILPDLFLETSIMHADIEGFAAWSSAREPVQVFKFLESLYEEFDALAESHKVFKVETTGEQYVAASGIPEPRADHAIVLARFASDCLKKMDVLTKVLEIRYGPDTGDLMLRVGIHSGPVTGGFMRGKQSRFQLFGDTMSTASIIHATGERGNVHLSEETAHLLLHGGKKKWVEQRSAKVHTNEKGNIQTYWLVRGNRSHSHHEDTSSHLGSNSSFLPEDGPQGLDSEQRWIEYNFEVLRSLLHTIAARNFDRSLSEAPRRKPRDEPSGIPLHDVKEIIELPKFDKEAARRQRENENVKIPQAVLDELRDYVTEVAGMYKDNPFHNFAHASYVVMAVTKFMNRIIAASEIDIGLDEDRHRSSTQSAIHDHTYGITSDPLTQFACVFSALIHDADHPGVPNSQLLKENHRLAIVYQNRSVAEQKSFDLSWDLFSDQRFDRLRGYMCRDDSELQRFRQLVINSVMATDLGDKELKSLRNDRWTKAFDKDAEEEKDARVGINRKATVVIEHLIQAADVAHMCQHWSIYRKWNQRLFEECYMAFRHHRAGQNPAEYWYKGEIGFFDFYIIPLSKKLRDCGVFGPTSDENLNYAKNNRAKWEMEGEAIVEEMLHALESQLGLLPNSKGFPSLATHLPSFRTPASLHDHPLTYRVGIK